MQVFARRARVVERVFAHSDCGDPHRVGVERHEGDESAVRVHSVLTDQFVVHCVIVTDDVSAHDAQARNDLVEAVFIERVCHVALRDITVREIRRYHVERGASGADVVGEINDGNIGLFV